MYNVTCNSNLKNVNISGNTKINSTSNVVGNMIGSGTAVTNLNYTAITNKPDLTGYATNTNLNNLSYSNLNNIGSKFKCKLK